MKTKRKVFLPHTIAQLAINIPIVHGAQVKSSYRHVWCLQNKFTILGFNKCPPVVRTMRSKKRQTIRRRRNERKNHPNTHTKHDELHELT